MSRKSAKDAATTTQTSRPIHAQLLFPLIVAVTSTILSLGFSAIEGEYAAFSRATHASLNLLIATSAIREGDVFDNPALGSSEPMDADWFLYLYRTKPTHSWSLWRDALKDPTLLPYLDPDLYSSLANGMRALDQFEEGLANIEAARASRKSQEPHAPPPPPLKPRQSAVDNPYFHFTEEIAPGSADVVLRLQYRLQGKSLFGNVSDLASNIAVRAPKEDAEYFAHAILMYASAEIAIISVHAAAKPALTRMIWRAIRAKCFFLFLASAVVGGIYSFQCLRRKPARYVTGLLNIGMVVLVLGAEPMTYVITRFGLVFDLDELRSGLAEFYGLSAVEVVFVLYGAIYLGRKCIVPLWRSTVRAGGGLVPVPDVPKG